MEAQLKQLLRGLKLETGQMLLAVGLVAGIIVAAVLINRLSEQAKTLEQGEP